MRLLKQYSDVRLGKCDVGDIIQGVYYTAKLEVLEIIDDDPWLEEGQLKYICKYIDGIHKGEKRDVYSFQEYYKL